MAHREEEKGANRREIEEAKRELKESGFGEMHDQPP